MVAISLYRGNLHKVPDVPRRLPPPPPIPKISVKSFKILLRRRARALSRLRSSTTTAAPTSDPNPNPDNSSPNPVTADNTLDNNNDGGNNVDDMPYSEPQLLPQGGETEGNVKFGDKLVKDEDSSGKLMVRNDTLVEGEGKEGKVNDDKVIEGDKDGNSLRKLREKSGEALVEEGEKKEVPTNHEPEKSNKEDATSEVEKRKEEVKERLEILNEKKHSLVQVLKQILNAEEQLKRQNSTTSGYNN